MKSGIYRIVNKVNGKIYIGSAVNLSGRKRSHWHHLRKEKHGNIHIQRSWSKHGEDAFRFEVIEYCPSETLIEREQYWMDECDPEYNIYRIAGSPLGTKQSKETRVKVSKSLMGNTRCLGYKHTEETKRKVSLAVTGRRHTEETKKIMSASQMGNTKALGCKRSTETKEKMGAWQRGRKLTEEHKRNMSIANKGKKPWNTGKHRSEETRAKLRAANLGKKQSEETKRKIGKASQGTGNPNALLTEQQVILSRYLHKKKGVPIRVLADMLSLKKSTLYMSVTGRSWKHIAYGLDF